ncbi:acetyl-CoA carboxylase biotin carboxyl carrier protein subunit [Altererythrobacter sp. B11]|uniref:acetyl-CoA carboxylase n=1 Tax=Altererythrobacter sp. B11 TaxID=2060312 RepID=UPI000DC716B7|nr:acetyl-CoA carboxylase [Altererythrobacter sp. B11]BBC72211.1 acetyl-CoA carboxylase biotin carboxyl carrier protein subunit [Altererythrobacter sp. B11]
MSLSRKDIDEIMHLLEASRFDRLSLEMDGLKLELVREGGARGRGASTSPTRAEAVPAAMPAPTPAPTAPSRREPVEGRAQAEGLVEIKSPLLGVFYRAPKPGEPPFVEVGSRVEADTVIGIIEVMKLMNSARAGVAGEVVQILGENGEMVEHGEALMLVRPD